MTERLADASEHNSRELPARLGIWDAVSVIVGIVVGSSIFRVPPDVFANVRTPWEGLALWGLGGVLSLLGALCYAELVTTYPRSGGDYVYLTRAYGPLVGFLFGWAHLGGILTGSIGSMAFVFADYACRMFGPAEASRLPGLEVSLAVGAILVLTAINILGVFIGKTAQNLLTCAKVIGLGAVIVSGLLWGGEAAWRVETPMQGPGPGLAIIFVLYAYGGWSDAAFVAAEVREPRKNLPRALILGIAGISAIYLLVNLAYLRALGFEGVRASKTPAADALRPLLGEFGERAMSTLVMISALGALNGLIFTGSRVHASLGADHRLLGWLGRWHVGLGTPALALATQAAISVTLVCLVGTDAGRGIIDLVLQALRFKTIPWQRFGGFEALVVTTAPVFWTFFFLAGMSVMVLRWKDGPIIRPFRTPFYPVTPILFCSMCVYMLYRSIEYVEGLALLAVVPLLCGVPAYFISRRMAGRPTDPAAVDS